MQPLRRRLESAVSGPVRWEITSGPGDATRLARRALECGAEVIISVGGDGTHNHVVNGFFDSAGTAINPGAALAVLPCGTGNDLRRTLGIGPRPGDGVKVLAGGARRRIDVGRIDYVSHDGTPAATHFVNIASLGISGLVDRFVDTTRVRHLGGTTAFYWATLRSFFSFRNRDVEMKIDGNVTERHRISAVVAANGRFFGGGMKVAPHALPDDGLLDMVCLGDFGLLDFLTKGHCLYAGTHLEIDKVWWRRVRRLTVRAAEPTLLDVDGECPGTLPVSISIVPAALDVFVDERGAATQGSQPAQAAVPAPDWTRPHDRSRSLEGDK